MTSTFKVGIKTKSDPTWVFNALRFANRGEAEAYAKDLFIRWTAVTEYTIEESDEAANTNFPVPSDRYRTQRGPP
jgi:hypothetical protein